jgi:transposase
VFQVHGVDAAGQVVIRRQLKRRFVLAFFQKLPACLVGIEACASAHYWARELQALGHTVGLMPPAYVKPYVIRYSRGREVFIDMHLENEGRLSKARSSAGSGTLI